LLSPEKVEDGGADEPDAGAALPKKPGPATEPPATAQATAEAGTEGDDDPKAEPKVDTPSRRKIKVDGEEVEVTEEELEKAYSFTAHNTRTAQKLAADRKAFETEQKEIRDLTLQYRAVLPKLEDVAQAAVNRYAGVDWDALRAEDPAAFQEHRAIYQLEQDKLKSVREEREAEETKARGEQATEFTSYVEREQAALLESVPEWRDESKRNTELAKVAEFAVKELGYTPEDVAQTFDHRAIKGLRLAYLGSQVLANAEGAKRKVSEARKSATPGAKKDDASPKVEQFGRAREKLRKSGREQDAAAAFNALYAKEELAKSR
jgi:hypothetical protein